MDLVETFVCPKLADLQEFLTDDLPEEQASRVSAHVIACDSCQQALHGLVERHGRLSTLEELLRARVGYVTDRSAEAQRMAQALTETPPPVAISRDQQQGPSDQLRVDVEASNTIGRFRLVRELGRGAYGIVYQAHDDALDRPVAVKVPHRQVVRAAGGIEALLKEARALAALHHPHIVCVYEARALGDDSCYIASQYIAGRNLAARLAEGRLHPIEAARLIAPLADALQHAHERGICHRDVKPANILLDESGQPYLTDFGLALKEDDVCLGPGLLGTPAYMSPEQARGNGHRVDGRTDIFSLGVVLYEALVGKRPFLARAVEDLLDMIAKVDAPSLRQKDRTIPAELERICSKALARRVTDRYPSAGDLADDLLAWLESVDQERKRRSGSRGLAASPDNGERTGGLAPSGADGQNAGGTSTRSVGGFHLRTRLGKGGMGVVYRAWQPTEQREVALKSLWLDDASARARFLTEIRALGKVQHPNLVRIYTSGADQDRLYYAMELIDGTGFEALLASLRLAQAEPLDEATWLDAVRDAADETRARERGLEASLDSSSSVNADPAAGLPISLVEPVPPKDTEPPLAAFHESPDYIARIVTIIHDVALAAQALHDAGVVHRDIKPDNIMLSRDGDRAVLMDLGIAKLTQDESGQMTRTRQFVGSLRYASPEQVLDAGQVDARTDIYSLGATLWELLTLRPIYGIGDDVHDARAMLKIEIDEPEPIRRFNRGVSLDLQAVVQKCLEKHPDRRYASAADLAEDLNRVLQGRPVHARPIGLATRAWRRLRRRPLVPGLIVMTVLLASALAAAVWPPLHAPANRLRVGIKPWVGFAPLVVAHELALCDADGVDLELIDASDTNDVETMLLGNQLDAGPLLVDSHALARADRSPTKVVLKFDMSLEADAIWAAEDIRQFSDLRGRRVAYVFHEAPHFLLLALCEQHGVDPRDLIATMPPSVPEAVELFRRGEVDAVVGYEPFLRQAHLRPGAHCLASAAVDPGVIVDTLAVRDDYLKRHPDHIEALIRAWFRGIELLENEDPAALEIARRFLGSPEGPATMDEYREMVAGMRFGYRQDNLRFFQLDDQGGNEFRRRMDAAQRRLLRHQAIRATTDPADADGSAAFLHLFQP